MNIELFSFNKRKNSTKAPTGSGTQVSVVLKEETSSMKPGFELTSSNLPANVNYVKAFGNWYYISDITLQTNTKWLISCVLDPLASFAAAIKNTTAFIEYADTYNSRIYDPRLAKLINATEMSVADEVGSPIIGTGYYVIDIVGKDGTGSYRINNSQISSIYASIYTWWQNFSSGLSWVTVPDAIMNLGFLFLTGDAASCIRSIRHLPGDYPSGGTPTSIYLGMYDTGETGIQIPFDSSYSQTINLTIPHPSNVMQRSGNTCEYTLYIPFIGNVSLPADILADETTLHVHLVLMRNTGELACRVYIDGEKTLGTYGANVASQIPIGGSGLSARSVMNSVASVGAAAIAGGEAMAAAKSASGGAAAATKALSAAAAGLGQLQATTSSVGGLSNVAAGKLDKHVRLTCSYWDVSTSGSNLTSLIGNPYYKTDTIGNHGFVKCSGASIDIAGYDDVIDTINSYMNNGIYIE